MSDAEQGMGGGVMGEEPKRRGCFFPGCIALILVFLLLVGLGAVVFVKAWREMPDVEPACEEYLDTVGQGDYTKAYGLVGSKWQAAQPLNKYLAFEKAMQGALGKCKSRKRTSWRVNFTLNGAVAVVGYEAEYENGKCAITFTLTKRDGKWEIQGVNYNSPAIINAMTTGKQ